MMNIVDHIQSYVEYVCVVHCFIGLFVGVCRLWVFSVNDYLDFHYVITFYNKLYSLKNKSYYKIQKHFLWDKLHVKYK